MLKRTWPCLELCEMIRLGSIGAKFVLLTSFALLAFCGAALRAQDFASARETFYQGDYDQCIELTREQVDKGIWNDFWSRVSSMHWS